MLQLRKRNITWLMILGALIIVALAAPAAPPALQLLVLLIFALAAAGSLLAFERREQALFGVLQRAVRSQTRISPQAKEAVERARRRGTYIDGGVMLLDVGLIASDGAVMRRTRSVSKDDQGVRPFITLKIEPEEADRQALIRFEIIDHSGQEQYIHEMRTYLRDGEMNILADHHLPLAGNRSISPGGDWGDWEMRVSIDGRLTGMHSFTLGASVNGRYSQEEDEYLHLTEPEDSGALSLEDLLRSQSRDRQSR